MFVLSDKDKINTVPSKQQLIGLVVCWLKDKMEKEMLVLGPGWGDGRPLFLTDYSMLLSTDYTMYVRNTAEEILLVINSRRSLYSALWLINQKKITTINTK